MARLPTPRSSQRGYMDFVAILMVLAMLSVIPFICGMLYEFHGWKRDCENLGAHVQGDVVYDCKPRAK